MTVEVMLFGPLRAFGDGRAVEIELRDGASVGEAREALVAALERLRPGAGVRALVARSVLATEHEVLADDSPVRSGTSLAVLPPVCGG